jgi:hypothetical protein
MDRFTGRRKLIRGSLSAPLVLTVASPAALARQSFEACLYRASQQSPENLPVFTPNKDGWVRMQLSFVKAKLEVHGRDVEERFVIKKDGLYYKVTDPCGLGYSTDQFKKNSIKADGKEWALVYVNESGAIVHVGPCAPQGAFPVTGSCWASFGGGAVG